MSTPRAAQEWATYARRLERVYAYIHEHLDERLDLITLAEVACLSPHHWHRVYHALHGETIADTVKRLRLHRAAGDLAQTSMDIGRVAARCGYANLQSFTRIFKSVYGMPPAQYRRQGTHAAFRIGARQPALSAHAPVVEVKDCAELHAVGVPHQGSYMQVGRAFETLFATLAARYPASSGLPVAGLFFEDPTATREAELRSMACALWQPPSPPDLPLVPVRVAGGPYAVLRHTGPYAAMKAAYDWLYGDWLPRSGREPADAPVVEHYLNNPRDTPPAALVTDICLPLRP